MMTQRQHRSLEAIVLRRTHYIHINDVRLVPLLMLPSSLNDCGGNECGDISHSSGVIQLFCIAEPTVCIPYHVCLVGTYVGHKDKPFGA